MTELSYQLLFGYLWGAVAVSSKGNTCLPFCAQCFRVYSDYRSFWSAHTQGDNIKYITECMYNSLLRTTGLGCGETSLLSLPCAPESVKTTASSGVYMYSAKLLWKSIYAYKCSFMSKFVIWTIACFFLIFLYKVANSGSMFMKLNQVKNGGQAGEWLAVFFFCSLLQGTSLQHKQVSGMLLWTDRWSFYGVPSVSMQ